jgi:hypothetical protein
VGDLAENASDAGAAKWGPHVVNNYSFSHSGFSFFVLCVWLPLQRYITSGEWSIAD